ncbi:U3 small nucleolar RNA-associated protein 15 homolog [Amblyomma americanum]|uniref:U3 small nucleolar RNA-associated protein 15 homolog n=1 Tax=Amblyomma americanum TaxID=6943 RepID=A0AAQ4D5P3_AMBAM
MADFKAVRVYSYPRAGVKVTEDTLYWKRLSLPVTIKDIAAINNVDISTEEPHSFAITCSSRVQVFNPVSREITGRFAKFSKAACGGIFRADGKLIAAGGEDGAVKLFDVKTRALLRQFTGHKRPTQRVAFARGGTQLLSFSDDSTVALWDIPGQAKVLSLDAHDDYVRSGSVCKANQDIVLSGSYDHHAKVFDLRTADQVVDVNHGAPVESVLMFPTGGVFLTAGGPHIRVWDVVAGRMLAQVTQHHKTVTCLKLASDGQRLLSGSLDRHVKVFDVATYQVVHTLDFPCPILSMDISPQDKVLVVGMTSGLISVQRRKNEIAAKEAAPKRRRVSSYFTAAHSDPGYVPREGEDAVVPERTMQKMAKYNTYLRKFEVSKALTCALRDAKFTREPQIAVAVMQELIRRRALKSAMAGRSGKELDDLMLFVTKNLTDPRFARILLDVATLMVEVYYPEVTTCQATHRRFKILQKVMEQETKHMQAMMELKGTIEMLLANSSGSREAA